MISSTDLKEIQTMAIRTMEEAQVKRGEKLRQLRAAIAEIEATDVAAVQALHRARTAKLKRDKCPRCFLADGISAELIATGLVANVEHSSNYLRCERECGFTYKVKTGR